MAYRSIYSYPPEEQEKIRARQREYRKQYRIKCKERDERFVAHFMELFRQEQEQSRKRHKTRPNL